MILMMLMINTLQENWNDSSMLLWLNARQSEILTEFPLKASLKRGRRPFFLNLE